MTYGEPQIAVWIGNYGYYAEGELRDRRVELPMRDEDLDAFLREAGLLDAQHEEIYISDYDGIPLGMPYGEAFSEYTHLDDLNLLAKQMDLDARGYEALELYAQHCMGSLDGPAELASAALQVDDIMYREYLRPLAADPYEGLARTVVDEFGGIAQLDREALEAHFDWETWGRELAMGFSLGERGYLDAAADMPDLGTYSRGELAEEIEPEWELERAPELAAEPVMAAVALPQRQEARTSPTPAGDEVSARAQSRALSQQRAQSPRARTRQ